MSREYYQHNFASFIFLLLVLIQFWSNGLTKGTGISVQKTTESSDGDIIDCIDIDKQPSFSDPLLKNHKVQVKPTSYPRGLEEVRNPSTQIFQSWRNNGDCPEGTIPILSIPKTFPRRVTPPMPRGNAGFNRSLASPNKPVHEFARVSLPRGSYFGGHGAFNVWTPQVEKAPSEYSLSSILVKSGKGNKLNVIEAGWQVLPQDKKARFFTYWTRDGYGSTGCYHLDCPGFVQTNRLFALGSPLEPVSTYAGDQYDISITIGKDQKTGNWWLQVQDQVIGYWAKEFFTSLANKAAIVSFGGEIANTRSQGHHTTTQMGSGHFSVEGFGKASYITKIGYIDNANAFRNASILVPSVTFPSCYDLTIDNSLASTNGVIIYFGGPGYSSKCQ